MEHVEVARVVKVPPVQLQQVHAVRTQPREGGVHLLLHLGAADSVRGEEGREGELGENPVGVALKGVLDLGADLDGDWIGFWGGNED